MTISATPSPRPRVRRVVFLCFDDMELLDVTGPANVFTMASRLLPRREGYEAVLIAERAGPVSSRGGIEVLAQRAVPFRGAVDTLVVPGGGGIAGPAAQALLPHLRRLAGRARRLVAVCGGAFLLAEAGLLQGRRCVTHWAGCAELARRYPDLQVQSSAIYVNDGHVWTSAGVTAGMDLALALVEADHGPAIALEVARWLVMYLRRPGGQAQFSAPLALQAASHEPLSSLGPWARDNLTADLSVAALARRAGMSERHFARVFADQVGITPAVWVLRLRVEAAREALERTGLQVQEIAARCGFGDAAVMHRAFQRELGVTPRQYRNGFRGGGAASR